MDKSPKQVIVMRADLNMRKGKMVAQGSHASMAAILDLMDTKYEQMYELRNLVIPYGSALDAWLNGPFKKICVGVNSEQDLLCLYEMAKLQKLPVALITDSGLTEFGGVPTHTCIAIGPDFPDRIDPLTATLKLL